MFIGMRGHDFETSNIADLADRCNKYDVKRIQLALKKSVSDFEEGKFTPGYAEEIGSVLSKKGIEVSVLGCYINPSSTNRDALEKELAFFEENLHYAKYMPAKTVGLETGFVGHELNAEKNHTEEAYLYLLENMKRLTRYAEKLGVNIAVEGVHLFVINSPKRMKRLLDDLNSPNLRVIFDPVNYINDENYMKQDEIIEEFFELLGDRCEVLHLKDFTLRDDKVSYAYPCTGMLNTRLIFKKLKQIKPDIPVMLEEVKEDMLEEVRNNVIREWENA